MLYLRLMPRVIAFQTDKVPCGKRMANLRAYLGMHSCYKLFTLGSASCTIVDKPGRPTMTPNLRIASSANHTAAGGSCGAIDRRIRAFLTGESDGQDVLGALYGHIAVEPVPARLRALLKI
jgi:hypothetical protein